MICNCILAGTDACNHCSNNDNIPKITTDNLIKVTELKVGHPVIQYWCSECDALLRKYDKYCHNCGCFISWDTCEIE